MKHVGIGLLASLVVMAVGCSLIDPLDGISDGVAPSVQDAATDVPMDAAPGIADGAPDGERGPATGCPDEREPNEAPPAEINAANDRVCGTVSKADKDVFFFVLQAGQPYTVRATSSAIVFGPSFELQTPDGNRARGSIDFSVASSVGGEGFITVTAGDSSTGPQDYQIDIGLE